MITFVDAMPLGGTIGGAFFAGLSAGYAIKKAIKIAAVIVGLFIAALAYLEYQRILSDILTLIGNKFTYRHGLHFCWEVYLI